MHSRNSAWSIHDLKNVDLQGNHKLSSCINPFKVWLLILSPLWPPRQHITFSSTLHKWSKVHCQPQNSWSCNSYTAKNAMASGIVLYSLQVVPLGTFNTKKSYTISSEGELLQMWVVDHHFTLLWWITRLKLICNLENRFYLCPKKSRTVYLLNDH